MSDTIYYEEQDQIGILRINRPNARNALNWEAQNRFAEIIQQCWQQPPAALIITGTGDKVFVAGGDLQELKVNLHDGAKLNRIVSHTLDQLRKLPCPVIAALNGHAVGGGAEIMTATDLRVMARHAEIRFVQVRMGLSAGWGGLGRLVALIGQSRAMEIMLSGRPISATEAQEIGLVHRICDKGEAVTTAITWAKELTALPKQAQATIKSLIYQTSQPTETFKTLEAQAFLALYGSSDNQEAIRAFREKRSPNFNQK